MNQGGGSSRVAAGRVAKRKGFFDRYKPEQGLHVRNGTAIGSGILAAWGAKFVFDRLSIYRTSEAWTVLLAYGVPVLLAVALALAIYWVVYRYRSSSDFLIATEGEMKKVSWSTRREIIGATKVVIAFTLLLALLLGVVDLAFMYFFRWIGVLKVAASVATGGGG